jgi:hypothetical protein
MDSRADVVGEGSLAIAGAFCKISAKKESARHTDAMREESLKFGMRRRRVREGFMIAGVPTHFRSWAIFCRSRGFRASSKARTHDRG